MASALEEITIGEESTNLESSQPIKAENKNQTKKDKKKKKKVVAKV